MGAGAWYPGAQAQISTKWHCPLFDCLNTPTLSPFPQSSLLPFSSGSLVLRPLAADISGKGQSQFSPGLHPTLAGTFLGPRAWVAGELSRGWEGPAVVPLNKGTAALVESRNAGRSMKFSSWQRARCSFPVHPLWAWVSAEVGV